MGAGHLLRCSHQGMHSKETGEEVCGHLRVQRAVSLAIHPFPSSSSFCNSLHNPAPLDALPALLGVSTDFSLLTSEKLFVL